MTTEGERRRRQWRIELREAAIERKALKERIALLEERIENQRQSYEVKISGMLSSLDAHRQTIEALLVENKALKVELANK